MTVEATGTFHSYKPAAAMAAESLAGIIFLTPGELTVTHVADATGLRTALSEGTHYVLAGSGLAGTATITAQAVWPADDLFEIERFTARTQLADFPSLESVSPAAVEAALDRLARVDQEQDYRWSDTGGRALMVPTGEVIGTIPALAARLGKGLAFDALTGEPIAVDTAATAQIAAAASAVTALAAQIAAEAARDATLTAYDQFDDRYLGPKAANPSTDNDGNPLIAGSLYYNTTAQEMRLWTGAAWVAAYVSGAGLVSKTGDAMTGLLVTIASALAEAGFRLPHGIAPTAPVNGDVWTTTAGLFARINGVTRQLVGLNGAQTLTEKTLDLASNTLTATLAQLNSACSDADLAADKPGVAAVTDSFTAGNADNNTHKTASGASKTVTLNATPATGVSFSARFTTAWSIACAGGLSKGGAAPGGVTSGSIAANSLITFFHEGAGVWVATGAGLT